MPVFLDSLKRSGHLDRINIALCIVGSRKLKEFNEDYASQGWDVFAPRLTIYGFDADKNACDEMNAELETRQVNWTEKHIPLALWNSYGKSTLYITKYPGCSSLYPPNISFIERFSGNAELMKIAG